MNSASDIWQKVLLILEQNLTATTVKTFFEEIVPLSLSDNTLTIYVPSEYCRGIIRERYTSHVEAALYEIFSQNVGLLVADELPVDTPPVRGGDILECNKGFTFNNFVVGPSNKYAHAVATAVAESPGGIYNPLFIYGDSGLGKTHLLYAIGNTIRAKNPHFNIIYVKGDDFMNELVEALQKKTTIEFRQRYRSADLFLVDDIQFISGKEGMQLEFFHTFDTLKDLGKQIVITSDRPPKDLTLLVDRLRSRFESGILADVQPPEIETRIAIIRNKSIRNGLNLSDDVIEMIAQNITSNIRQIEGAVNRLLAYKSLHSEKITLVTAGKALKDFNTATDKPPTPELIISETCAYFNIDDAEIKGKRRTKDTANARHIAMYLVRKMTDLSFDEIGRQFGGRDHTTVMSAVEKIEIQSKTPGGLSDDIRDISSNINNKT